MDPWKTSERCVTTNCLDPRGPPLFNSEQVRELTVPNTIRRSHRDHHQNHSHRRADSIKHCTVDTPASPTVHGLSKIKEGKKIGEKEYAVKAKSSPTLVLNSRGALDSSPLPHPRKATDEIAFSEDPRDDKSRGRRTLGWGAFPHCKMAKIFSNSNAGGFSIDRKGCRGNNRGGVQRIPSLVLRKLLLVTVLLIIVAVITLCGTFGKEQILLHQRLITFPTNPTTPFRSWRDNWTSLRSLVCPERPMKGVESSHNSSFLSDIRRRVEESWCRASDKISSVRDAYSSSVSRHPYLYYFRGDVVKPTLSSFRQTIKLLCFQFLGALQQVAQASASFVVYIMNNSKLVYRQTVGTAYKNEHLLSPVMIWKSLRNTTFIDRKSRFFFWNWVNSTTRASKEYSKLSSAVDMRKETDTNDNTSASNASSSTPPVVIHNHTDSSVIDAYACSGNRNKSSGWTLIQQWARFVHSSFHFLQNLWGACMLRTSRFFIDVIHCLYRCKHSLHKGGRGCLYRVSSLLRMICKPRLILPVSTSQSEGNGTFDSSRKMQRKWWRGWARREDHFAVLPPKIIAKQYLRTLFFGIHQRILQWGSHVTLVPHTILRRIHQRLSSFWNLIRIPSDLQNIAKKPNENVDDNRSKNLNGKNSGFSVSFSNSSLGVDVMESSEEKHSYSCQKVHLFYFFREEEMEKSEVSSDDRKSSDVRKIKRESLSLANTGRLREEIAKKMSLRSSALQNFAAETGVFIHFTLAEEELLCHSSTDNPKQKSFRQRSPSHAEHSDICSLYDSYTYRHPGWRFSPSLFYQLNHSLDLLRAIRPENGMSAMKEEKREKERRLLLQKEESKRKKSINASRKEGSAECLPREDEERWKLERETIVMANEKCQRERDALLEEVMLQKSWCSEKAVDDIKAAVQKENAEKAEELRVILNQQCDERLLEMNTSLYAQWNKGNSERFDMTCTQRMQAERKQDNETCTALLAAQMQENEVLQRNIHELQETTREISSSCEDQHFSTCPCCIELNNYSQGVLYGSQELSSRLLDAEKDVILSVQKAIEMRCFEECQGKQSAPSRNSNTRQQEDVSLQCITEIASLHERLGGQVSKMFSLSSAEVSSSWKEVALTILQPESLGKYCAVSWNEEDHRNTTHYTEGKWATDRSPTAHSIPLLSTFQSLLQCARSIGTRVFWLIIGIGAICILRGFYFLMEDNARLRCELQQANITVIQERMMNMDGMDGPLYTPPQKMRKNSRKSFVLTDAIEVSEEGSMIGASVKELKQENETTPRVRDNAAMGIALCFLSPTVESVFDYLSDCHFLQHQLIWSRVEEQQGKEEPDTLSSPCAEAKLSLGRPRSTLEGKEGPSYFTAPHCLSATLQQHNVHFSRRVVKEINHLFLLLGALFKGYLQMVEDRYMHILVPFFPPELIGGKEMYKRRRGTSPCPCPSDDGARVSTHGGERPFLCCYKWRQEAEKTKHLMEMQAETIRQLQQEQEEADC